MDESLGAVLQEQMAAAMDDLREHQRNIRTVREKAAELTVSTRSKDRTLTVVVGDHGKLTSVKFYGTDYQRMPPAQLSAVLVETINAARQELKDKVAEMFTPMREFGAKFRESINASLDINTEMAPLLAELRSNLAQQDKEE